MTLMGLTADSMPLMWRGMASQGNALRWSSSRTSSNVAPEIEVAADRALASRSEESLSKRWQRARSCASVLRLLELGENGFAVASRLMPVGELSIPCFVAAREYRRVGNQIARLLGRRQPRRMRYPSGFLGLVENVDERTLAQEDPEHLLEVCHYCHGQILDRCWNATDLPVFVRWTLRRFVERMGRLALPESMCG